MEPEMHMKRNCIKEIILLFSVLICSGTAFAEELSIVTANAWSGMSNKGFISCEEYEPDDVRGFRTEILISGLKELDADIIVLNGLNPAVKTAGMLASELEMSVSAWVSRSGMRIGPVSLPLNLKEGDAVLTAEALSAEPAGRLSLNSLISTGVFTFAGRDGVQVIGRKITVPGISGDDGNAFALYVFSAVWSESVFNDKDSLDRLMTAYLSGEIDAEKYPEYISRAVEGAEARRAEAEKTLSFINSVAGSAPVILAGSLNALPGSGELQILKDAGFTDVYERSGRGPGNTVDSKRNSNFAKLNDEAAAVYDLVKSSFRADYILIRGSELKPRSADIVLDEPVYGVFPSNRFGVRAVIDISK